MGIDPATPRVWEFGVAISTTKVFLQYLNIDVIQKYNSRNLISAKVNFNRKMGKMKHNFEENAEQYAVVEGVHFFLFCIFEKWFPASCWQTCYSSGIQCIFERMLTSYAISVQFVWGNIVRITGWNITFPSYCKYSGPNNYDLFIFRSNNLIFINNGAVDFKGC